MIETGETLRNTRISSGVSLEEASKDLNIPVLYLEQIEAGAIGAFDDIYKLKQMIIDYTKYLGVSSDVAITKFNEYMFEYTSRIPLAEIEKEVKKINKEEDNEDRIASPYTKIQPQEKTLPYIICGVLILVLVVMALIWSIRQVTVNNTITDSISYFDKGE